MSDFYFNLISQPNVNSLQTGNWSGPVNRTLLISAQNSTDESDISAMLLLSLEWGKSVKLYAPTLQESADNTPEAFFSCHVGKLLSQM